jgi:glycosyltransferase involved in cell wall biosynthesis
MGHNLAIIIPAFKGRFLERTLRSVLAQTDRRFCVYVGDDASPAPLEQIVKSAGGSGKIVYKRFPENLGGKSLVKHWDRCIRMSNEPWIWLFSDDDLMMPDCVAAIYRELETTREAYDLYRFNTIQIDAEDRLISVSHPHPCPESALEFAYFRLSGMRHSTAPELVFSRAAYERMGCFPEFPFAWHSDDAGIITLAGSNGIWTIPRPRVRFRRSGENLSTTVNPLVTRGKLLATMAYFEFLEERFRDERIPELMLDMEALRVVGEPWFVRQVGSLNKLLSVGDCRQLAQFAARAYGGSYRCHFASFIKRNVKWFGKRVLGAAGSWRKWKRRSN